MIKFILQIQKKNYANGYLYAKAENIGDGMEIMSIL